MANRLIGVGEKFREFEVPAVVSIKRGKEFKTISSRDMAGKWNVVFFWPMS